MSDSHVNEPSRPEIDIEARVRRMARELAWVKALVVVLAVSQAALMASFAGLAVFMVRQGRPAGAGAQKTQELRARRLEITDSKGRAIATVGQGPSGAAEIALSGSAGRGLVLSADERGEARLSLRGPAGRNRAEICVDPGGAARLRLTNTAGANSLVLTAEPQAGARIDLFDSKGRVRTALLTASDGHPGLAMSHADGRRRASLFVDTTGTAALLLAGQTGRGRLITPR
ncbi:MAG: hypothetical protein ACUVTZ_14930 [Armatimonadota bacterium]